MAVDYANTFIQLGNHLRILRKTEALWIHSHFSTNANYSKRLIETAYDETLDEEDLAEVGAKNDLEETDTPALSSVHDSQVTSFEDNFFQVLDVELETSQRDIDSGAISYVHLITASGKVTINERLGRWGALRRQMIADSETIQKNTVAFPNPMTAAAGNVGSLVLTTTAGDDYTFAGDIILEVVDDSVGTTTFSVEHKLATALIDGTTSRTSATNMTLGEEMQDGNTGLTLQVDLDASALAETGDDGNMFSATTITDLVEGNSDRGTVFIKVTRQAAAPIWLIEWYSDSSLETLVGSDTSDTTVGTDTITINDTANGSTFSSTLDRAAAAVQLPAAGNSDDDISFDIKNPRLGDRWVIPDITNDEAGNFATKLGKRYPASLNSDGAPTISDALAANITVS